MGELQCLPVMSPMASVIVVSLWKGWEEEKTLRIKFGK
jgi:hypothetical protein